MKQNNKKFYNAMHKFVGVLDKYESVAASFLVTQPMSAKLKHLKSVQKFRNAIVLNSKYYFLLVQ